MVVCITNFNVIRFIGPGVGGKAPTAEDVDAFKHDGVGIVAALMAASLHKSGNAHQDRRLEITALFPRVNRLHNTLTVPLSAAVWR
jgi:hypothetical protein